MVNIEIDINTGTYWYYLEERWGTSNDILHFNNLTKLQGLLINSNDPGKIDLSRSIEN